MYPESLLNDVPWCFNDSTYASLNDFVKAVSDYRTSIELQPEWKADKVAISVPRLNVFTEEVYDENDDEVDLSFEIHADGSSFTNGELLLKLHNAFAEKMSSGFEFGDHCYFEGLVYENSTDGQYNCLLGS